jgi:transposase-like protein
MSKKQTRYDVQFKSQLALKAAKGLQTINPLASEHGMHPHQVSDWKHQLLEVASTIFSRDGSHTERDQ